MKKDYIIFEDVRANIFNLLKEVRADFINDKTEERINDDFPDEFLRAYALEVTCRINEDMRNYLNSASRNIIGNFNNIERDYQGDFPAMVKRLNEGEASALADKDREFLSSWFWETCGTFGIKYNFASFLAECFSEEDFS